MITDEKLKEATASYRENKLSQSMDSAVLDEAHKIIDKERQLLIKDETLLESGPRVSLYKGKSENTSRTVYYCRYNNAGITTSITMDEQIAREDFKDLNGLNN